MSHWPLLKVSQLSVQAEHGFLLRDIQLTIHSGERIGITGASGAGKSLLIKSLLDMLPPGVNASADEHCYQWENYRLDLPLASASQKRYWYQNHIGMVFQHGQASFNPLMKIGRQIMELPALPNETRHSKIRDSLHNLGFGQVESIMDRYPHELSGGDLQKIMLAHVFARPCRLIIADEPSNALDKLTENEIFGILANKLGQMHAACILVSHDTALLHKHCHKVYEIKNARIKAFPAMPTKTGNIPFANATDAKNVRKLLSVSNLSVAYVGQGLISRKKTRALHDISFDIFENETLAITGMTGSGKTTIIKSLTREIPFDTGHIELLGKPIQEYNRKSLAKNIQVLHQNPDMLLNPNMTAMQLLMEPWQQLHGLSVGIAREKAYLYLNKIKLPTGKSLCYPGKLSGGQKQRLALGRILAMAPKLLILDEPFSALDQQTKEDIKSFILSLKKEFNFTVLLISHDLEMVKSFADRIIILKQGEIVEQGNSAAIFNNPQSPYTRRLFSTLYPSKQMLDNRYEQKKKKQKHR